MVCMMFLMLVGVGCCTVSGETVDPLGQIVTGLGGDLLAGPSVKKTVNLHRVFPSTLSQTWEVALGP